MRVLTVDIGNTRVKVDLWDENNHLSHREFKEITIPELKEMAVSSEASKIVVSSVRKEKELITHDFIDLKVINFGDDIEDFYGSRINYNGKPGADRIAAYLGVLSNFQSEATLIADSGTALTLDIVNKDGEFCGGNISLGLFTRLKALAGSTSLLPYIEDLTECVSFGKDTKSAIASGALYGEVGEILFAIERARKEYNIKKIVLTGGDAEVLLPVLKAEGVNCDYDPYLVARGLNYHTTLKGHYSIQ